MHFSQPKYLTKRYIIVHFAAFAPLWLRGIAPHW